jgi:hypothetical protein
VWPGTHVVSAEVVGMLIVTIDADVAEEGVVNMLPTITLQQAR